MCTIEKFSRLQIDILDVNALVGHINLESVPFFRLLYCMVISQSSLLTESMHADSIVIM